MDQYLNFNGKTIFYIANDGQYWIAIKPICEALGINYNRQFQNLKSDKILGQLFAEQQMVAADNRLRKMIALPEKYIYGWIFQIRSDSPDLHKYKLKVYEILYDYFKGTLTDRQKLLMQRIEENQQINNIKASLQKLELFCELQELEKKQKKYTTLLKQLDNNLLQLNLFQD